VAIGEAATTTATTATAAQPREHHTVRRPPRLAAVVGRLTAANLVLVAVTVVTAPLQARVLGPAGRGELAAIGAPLGLAPVLLSLGLGIYAFRAAAKGERPGSLFATIGLLSVILGVIGAAMGPFVAGWVGHDHPVVRTWVVIGFALLPLSLVIVLVNDIAAGLERWGSVLATRLVPPLVMLVGIVALAAAGRLTVGGAAALTVIGGTLPAVFLLPLARRYRPWRLDRAIARQAIPFGLTAWVGGLGTALNVRVDQLLMTRMVSARELGLYAIAVTASGVLVNPFASALASGTMPKFASGDVRLVERVTRATMLAVLVISAAVAVVVPIGVPLVFGSDFKSAVPMIWMLLLAGFPLAGGVVLGSALTSFGRPGYTAWAQLVALVITVPGLFLLLPSMGGVGAALVSLLSYTASFLMLVVVTWRQFGARPAALLLIRPADVVLASRMVRERIPDRFLRRGGRP
jgi:O-antigen/teichoic acid export membrane protein